MPFFSRSTILVSYSALTGLSLILAGLTGSSIATVLLWSILLALLIRWMANGSRIGWGILLALDLLAMVAPFFVVGEGSGFGAELYFHIGFNAIQVGLLALLLPSHGAGQNQPFG